MAFINKKILLNLPLSLQLEIEKSRDPADPAEFLFQKAKYHDCFVSVGDHSSDKVEMIGVVSSQLAAHSPVFRVQLADPDLFHENGLRVPSISPEVFKLMLIHVYGGELPEMARSTAAQLAICADMYKIPKLVSRACHCIVPTTVQDVFPALWCVANIECPELEPNVIKIIQEETECLVESSEFLDLDSNCLDLITKQERLNISELQLWKALVKWAKERVQVDSAKTLRQHLQTTLQFVRLSTLNQDEIIKEVMPTNILSLEEVTNLLSAVSSNQPWQLPGLCPIQKSRETAEASGNLGVDSGKLNGSFQKTCAFVVSKSFKLTLFENQSFSSFTLKTQQEVYIETFTFRSRARSEQGDQPIYPLNCSVTISKIEKGICKESRTLQVRGMVVVNKDVSFPLKFRNGQALKLETKSWYEVVLRFSDSHPVYDFNIYYGTQKMAHGSKPTKDTNPPKTFGLGQQLGESEEDEAYPDFLLQPVPIVKLNTDKNNIDENESVENEIDENDIAENDIDEESGDDDYVEVTDNILKKRGISSVMGIKFNTALHVLKITYKV